MDERLTLGGPDEAIEAADPGSTFVLGVDGWESVDYVDPEEDWTLGSDGSFTSPDGTTRSWPLAGPEPT